jgi:hypothetical protein
VPARLIFTEAEEAFLRELTANKVEFLIVGLAAATLQGAPAVTQDIDLWFKNLDDVGIVRALRKVGGFYVPSIGLNPPMFAGDSVKLFDIVLRMDGLASFDEEAKCAVCVPLGRIEVRVLPLERIIASKRAANRDKDKLSLPVLENALLVARNRKTRK